MFTRTILSTLALIAVVTSQVNAIEPPRIPEFPRPVVPTLPTLPTPPVIRSQIEVQRYQLSVTGTDEGCIPSHDTKHTNPTRPWHQDPAV